MQRQPPAQQQAKEAMYSLALNTKTPSWRPGLTVRYWHRKKRSALFNVRERAKENSARRGLFHDKKYSEARMVDQEVILNNKCVVFIFNPD
jgi:hypothetical protein